jgi:hypothetical protein
VNHYEVEAEEMLHASVRDVVRGAVETGHLEAQVGAEMSRALRADARALWSVRVLDAFKRQRRHGPYSYPHRVIEFEADNGTVYVDVTAPGFHQTFEDVKSFEASRHAAALAVFPTLPAEVRAKLGECP